MVHKGLWHKEGGIGLTYSGEGTESNPIVLHRYPIISYLAPLVHLLGKKNGFDEVFFSLDGKMHKVSIAENKLSCESIYKMMFAAYVYRDGEFILGR